MDYGCGQLQHAGLLGSLRSNLNGNSAVAGKGIGQHFELLTVNPDSLRHGVPELLDSYTNLGCGEICLGCSHIILIFWRKEPLGVPVISRFSQNVCRDARHRAHISQPRVITMTYNILSSSAVRQLLDIRDHLAPQLGKQRDQNVRGLPGSRGGMTLFRRLLSVLFVGLPSWRLLV